MIHRFSPVLHVVLKRVQAARLNFIQESLARNTKSLGKSKHSLMSGPKHGYHEKQNCVSAGDGCRRRSDAIILHVNVGNNGVISVESLIS
jgi:hypothetical protein